MTKYMRNGLPVEYEEEDERLGELYLEHLRNDYSDDDDVPDDLFDRIVEKYASPGYKKAIEKRDKYYEEMRTKGIIVN